MIKYVVEVHIYGLNSYDSELLVLKFKLLDKLYKDFFFILILFM